MLLTACQAVPTGPSLTQVSFDDLPGWADAVPEQSFAAWRQSCQRVQLLDPAAAMGGKFAAGTVADWLPLCDAVAAFAGGGEEARAFIETNFTPYQVRDGDTAEGLFTGYFEPIVRAAEQRNDSFTVPIHGLPGDHVTVHLKDFDSELSGRSIVGRVEGGRLQPYPDRGTITGITGNTRTAGENVLYWADDELDVFILQVQGSGIVELPDGARRRIAFAGHNGHDYQSIGRWLIEQNELQTAGWQDIRAWMKANPGRATELLARNRRYIFFRDIDGDGAQGAAGVKLTAGHSLAVDPSVLPLNVPLWLDTVHPGPDQDRLQRLVIAQDTGNAIRGAIRGDLFWGVGPDALAFAGRMKSPGFYYLLLPNHISPAS